MSRKEIDKLTLAQATMLSDCLHETNQAIEQQQKHAENQARLRSQSYA